MTLETIHQFFLPLFITIIPLCNRVPLQCSLVICRLICATIFTTLLLFFFIRRDTGSIWLFFLPLFITLIPFLNRFPPSARQKFVPSGLCHYFHSFIPSIFNEHDTRRTSSLLSTPIHYIYSPVQPTAPIQSAKSYLVWSVPLCSLLIPFLLIELDTGDHSSQWFILAYKYSVLLSETFSFSIIFCIQLFSGPWRLSSTTLLSFDSKIL